MAYAARLLPRIQHAGSPGATPLSDPHRPSVLRVGALCGSPPIKNQKSVAKCATSVVDGGAAFGVKEDTRPILVIDNYDRFTYNLCQYMGEVGADFEVYRNDEITVVEIKKISPRGILISPGPGTPHDSGISLQTVKELGPSIPLFGVCSALERHLEGRLSVLLMELCMGKVPLFTMMISLTEHFFMVSQTHSKPEDTTAS